MTVKYYVSDAAIDIAAEFEGFREDAYRDIVGIPTIGYGLTRFFHRPGQPRVQMGDSITLEDAEYGLQYTMQKFWDEVEGLILVPLEQHQVDALASLIYNIGPSAFAKSTLLRKLNSFDYEGAELEFHRWNKAGGKPVKGLTRRRAAEANHFGGR